MDSKILYSVVDQQRQAFAKSPFSTAHERRTHLKRLRRGLLAAQHDLAQAVHQDFGGRSQYETAFAEVLVAAGSLQHAEQHLDDWMRERPASLGWALQPARAYVLPQPVGVVGIMASWNYPVFVSLSPMAGALAAGNRVVLKPSESTPHTAQVLEKIIASTFAPDHVTVIQGDVEIAREFAASKWDHLIFTGSARTGREVMRAASANLTPLTLELGGKCPAIVCEDAQLERAADAIIYGKFLNAGQTCVAPDYLLLPDSLVNRILPLLKSALDRLYPNAVQNPDYTSLLRQADYDRLTAWLAAAESKGAKIIAQGDSDRTRKRLAPCFVTSPPLDTPLMTDEIFGPVLPIVTYAELNQALDFVNARPRPLALYAFTTSQRIAERIRRETVSGGFCLNDTIVHVAAESLPFGGIGASGFGAYHGQAGFDACSHLKPVFERRGPSLGRLIRPPYGNLQERLRKLLLR
ncbi:aldehyde dehydrogenase [Bryobacterales bacterium F-183]|nr:aldehyde dehydrogenase [Bryobacterales bacterium F-183]